MIYIYLFLIGFAIGFLFLTAAHVLAHGCKFIWKMPNSLTMALKEDSAYDPAISMIHIVDNEYFRYISRGVCLVYYVRTTSYTSITIIPFSPASREIKKFIKNSPTLQSVIAKSLQRIIDRMIRERENKNGQD